MKKSKRIIIYFIILPIAFTVALPRASLAQTWPAGFLAQIASQIETIRQQIRELQQRITTLLSQQPPPMCDAFSGPNNGGFVPKQPLFSSATITQNTGNSVTVHFETSGPTPVFPGLMADLAVAEGITNSRAKRVCEKKQWDNKDCKFKDTYPDSTDIGVGSFPGSVDIGLFTSSMEGDAVYTCTCDTGGAASASNTEGAASASLYSDATNVGFLDALGVFIRDSRGNTVFKSSLEYFFEEIYPNIPNLESQIRSSPTR